MTRCADPDVMNGFQKTEISKGQADLLEILYINEAPTSNTPKENMCTEVLNPDLLKRFQSQTFYYPPRSSLHFSSAHVLICKLLRKKKINSVFISGAWLRCFVKVKEQKQVRCLILPCSNMFEIRIILSI